MLSGVQPHAVQHRQAAGKHRQPVEYTVMDQKFKLVSPFQPAGDQPQAIAGLVRGLQAGYPDQVLLGVTGSGKTFTMARVIEEVQRPALVIAPNKTLAAQLYSEFKELFPENGVEYFVSYYDYYQPEAYIPQSDTYIEKDSAINDAIDKMRHRATYSLLTRRDVLIVASVSCIYGLGAPEEYRDMTLTLKVGEEFAREDIQQRLVYMLYERNDISFHRGAFRVRGDVLEIFPAYEEDRAVRVELFGDTIEAVNIIDPLRGPPVILSTPSTGFGSRPRRSRRSLRSDWPGSNVTTGCLRPSV
jgi:excinuclease ABC subunit B